MSTHILLFGPMSDRDLRRQHPELNEIKEFEGLGAKELLFVWWISNPTSPIVLLSEADHRTKIIYAFKQVWGKGHDPKKLDAFASNNFPDKIRLAMERMKKMEPNIRAKARMMAMKTVVNFEKMVNVDVSDFIKPIKDENGKVIGKELDASAQNSYITNSIKVAEALPKMIQQVEDGFGITEVNEDDMPQIKAIDRFHQRKKDKD